MSMMRFGIDMATQAIKELGRKNAQKEAQAAQRRQREIDGHLYFDPSNPQRSTPRLPPGASYDANVIEAFKHANDPLPAKLWWFYNRVKPGGDWDFKVYPEGSREDRIEWTRAGNYNFGLTGAAAGIPPELLRRGAGAAQLGTNWKPSFGLPFDKSGSMGDDPWDTVWVNEGIREQHRRGRWSD